MQLLFEKVMQHSRIRRLRWIDAWPSISYCYPQFSYSKYKHTCNVAKLVEHLGKYLFDMDKESIEKVKILALIHDIGHGPYTYLCEQAMQRVLGTAHENRSWLIFFEEDEFDVSEEDSEKIYYALQDKEIYELLKMADKLEPPLHVYDKLDEFLSDCNPNKWLKNNERYCDFRVASEKKAIFETLTERYLNTIMSDKKAFDKVDCDIPLSQTVNMVESFAAVELIRIGADEEKEIKEKFTYRNCFYIDSFNTWSVDKQNEKEHILRIVFPKEEQEYVNREIKSCGARRQF